MLDDIIRLKSIVPVHTKSSWAIATKLGGNISALPAPTIHELDEWYSDFAASGVIGVRPPAKRMGIRGVGAFLEAIFEQGQHGDL